MKFPGNSWGQQSSTIDLVVEGDSCLPAVVSGSESLWHPEVHWDTSRWEQRVWFGMLRLERYFQMKGLPRTRNCFFKEYRNWSRALAPLAGTRVAWLSNELVIHWSPVCASPNSEVVDILCSAVFMKVLGVQTWVLSLILKSFIYRASL